MPINIIMITSADRLSGHILASSPAMFREDIQQQVILLISHTSQLAIGVQINRMLNFFVRG